jgi:hypothetical protein
MLGNWLTDIAKKIKNDLCGGGSSFMGYLVYVDAKSALSANHTASRKAGFARAERESDVPVNFS